jgi:molecular chaperone HtpG
MSEATLQAEKREFRTELKQLLHLITHSLYSNKEIFLRELISNASDAINRIKFDSLSHEELLEGNKDWKIKVKVDRDKGTLTVSDNGIGLNRDSAVENLGTIAHSGTRSFLESLKKADTASRPDLIGQFGVGFYSAFMVADRVTVISRMAGDRGQGVKWESDGQGEFTVEPIEKEQRGTDVILHLKEDSREFLDEHRLRAIIHKFSDFLEHPVVMEVEKEENGEKKTVEEPINSRKAIWLRNRNEVTAEEYNEFYKQISGDFTDPAAVIHYTAEGTTEFRVLLFIPSHRPMQFDWGEVKVGPRLYIQRVLIMENCEALLPPYLRFVQGVVDSSDLPLNISREILQENPLLVKIQKDLVRSVLKKLSDLMADEHDKYLAFYRGLGSILKEGLRDFGNREKVADLLLFESIRTEPGKYVSLTQYTDKMLADQPEIYYLIGDSREQLAGSPYLESVRAKGWDVLLLTDPIDEFMIPALREYKGKKLTPVDQSNAAADQDAEKRKSEATERFKKLLEYLKSKLPEVGEVRLSTRLKESASCLVAGEGAMSAHLERLMQRMGRGEMADAGKRVLEINADHPAVQALNALVEKSPDDPRLESCGRLLYEQAVLAEGSRLKDPAAFAQRINDLIARVAGS